MFLVWFADEGNDAIRDVELTVTPSNKALHGGSSFAVDTPPPTYSLQGYFIEPANSPRFAFIARKKPF